jgi:hypothetical protein
MDLGNSLSATQGFATEYGIRSLRSPLNGTENRSVSEAPQLVPSGKDADLDWNQSPDRVEIMRPSSNPNAGLRLRRNTLAICPAPLASLTEVLHSLSSC